MGLMIGRWAFLAAVLVFVVLGLRGRGEDIGAALLAVDPWRVLAGLVAVVGGLQLTLVVWLGVLRWLGGAAPAGEGARVFFVGQLGKYIPGSVWSIAAQAGMARRLGMTRRSVAGVSLLFLWLHTTTGLLVGGLHLGIAAAGPAVKGVAVGLCGAGATLSLPPVLRNLAVRLGGSTAVVPLPVRYWLGLVCLMTAAWGLYGWSLVAVTPGLGAASWLDAVGIYALAYAIGVLVVVAPAGAGAREAILILLMQPTVGLAAASAGALLSRLVHTVGDLVCALIAALAARRAAVPVSRADSS